MSKPQASPVLTVVANHIVIKFFSKEDLNEVFLTREHGKQYLIYKGTKMLVKEIY